MTGSHLPCPCSSPKKNITRGHLRIDKLFEFEKPRTWRISVIKGHNHDLFRDSLLTVKDVTFLKRRSWRLPSLGRWIPWILRGRFFYARGMYFPVLVPD